MEQTWNICTSVKMSKTTQLDLPFKRLKLAPASLKFLSTRPKPPYGRQGLAKNFSIFAKKNFSIFALSFFHFCNTFHLHWGSTELLWCKKRDVTDVGPQPGAKNVTSLTGGSNWPPLVQKTLPLLTGGSNWPPLVQKTWRYSRGGPTDLLDV